MDSRNYRLGIPRIRVLSLGNCGVGKSCLIKRYCEQRFVQRYLPTIGIDYGSTTVDVDGRKASIHFFDTSGSPLFEEVRSEFYPDMQGVMLVYDVTDRKSFISLDAWMAELRHNLGHNSIASLVLVVVGTRSDTGGSAHGRQVPEADGKAWATRHGAKHVVTSAALGTGVTNAFMTLFSDALQIKENFTPSPGGPPFSGANRGPPPGIKVPSSSAKQQHQGTAPNRTGASSSSTNSSSTSYNKTNETNNNNNNSSGSTNKPHSAPTSTPSNGNAKPQAQNGNNKQSESCSDPEAVSAIHRLLHSTDHFHKMQLNPRAVTKDEVNKAYRRLAGLVHPDKCKAPGAEEAFKMLAQARNTVLGLLTETTV